ncbi:Dihydroorotate dehydrogenase (quinone), mitochondrial [Sporothrix epigloea]|uniref:Dihydroorotate dehydrogenase (Quinone), mitochondrial n=1 Tax=Sporothrix epigloea TaxID=1892477 RepID=A0ABP0DAC5_9PEZI
MSSSSSKSATRVVGLKARRRAHIKPLASPSASSTTTTIKPRQKRIRTKLSKHAYQLILAAKGITRRVTRSMTRQQALLDQLTSSARSVPHQFVAEKLSLLVAQSASPSPTVDAGAIMLFNDTDGASYKEVHIKPGDDNSPIFLPLKLRTVVPNMDQYGRHNCGRHGGTAAKRSVHVICRDCRTSCPVAAMHCLPCGHVLCRSCLKEVVWTIDAKLHTTRIRDAIQRHMMNHVAPDEALASSQHTANAAQLGPKPAANEPDAPVQADADKALELAGMTCCGRSMHLDRHIACLDAATAAAYWLAHEVMLYPLELARHRCGWPDCGQILAPSCHFERHSHTMYYCVRCQGNSIYVREGYLLPARSCDEKGR